MDYIPKQRDIIYIDFNPSRGIEIQKRRPALVVSNDDFNKRTGLCVVCPITNRFRDYPSVVKMTAVKSKITGYIMTHQIRSVDFSSRNAHYVEKCDILTWINVAEIIQMIF